MYLLKGYVVEKYFAEKVFCPKGILPLYSLIELSRSQSQHLVERIANKSFSKHVNHLDLLRHDCPLMCKWSQRHYRRTRPLHLLPLKAAPIAQTTKWRGCLDDAKRLVCKYHECVLQFSNDAYGAQGCFLQLWLTVVSNKQIFLRGKVVHFTEPRFWYNISQSE